MKIESVHARVLSAVPQLGVSFGMGLYDRYSMVLVEVTADNGITGYGEAIARRGAQMTATAVNELYSPILIGQDPRFIEGLWVQMVDQLRRWGHTAGVVMEALSGIDMALWDLFGKTLKRPVWELLAGSGRSRVPCYASSVYMADAETMCQQAREQMERGFRRIKIKIGRPEAQGGADADIESVAAIRHAVGSKIALVVDANGAYSVAEAIRIARQLETINVGWFEEPIPPDDIEGYARLQRMTTIPLARGETDFGIFTLRDVIQRRLIDIVQPDIARSGGITGARHVYTLTYAANLAFAPHTGFSGGLSQLAALHVASAAPTLLELEYMFIDNPLREIFKSGYPKASGGWIDVPTNPGLGLDLDLNTVARFTVTL